MPFKTSDRKLDLLAEVELLRGLSRRELRRVGALVNVVDLPAGAELVRQGSYGRQFFIIVDGTAEVVRDGVNIATLGVGDVVGELAMLSRERRTATVTATGPVRALVGSTREFWSLLGSFPNLATSVRDTAAVRTAANAA